MVVCAACGERNRSGRRFCTSCGELLDLSTAAPAPPPEVEAAPEPEPEAPAPEAPAPGVRAEPEPAPVTAEGPAAAPEPEPIPDEHDAPLPPPPAPPPPPEAVPPPEPEPEPVKATCPSCGYANPASRRFCRKCDTLLDLAAAPQPAPPTAVEAPAPAGEEVRAAQPVQEALAHVEEVAQAATTSDRPDLVDRLDSARTRLAGRDMAVAVVGEYKQGKSTLINAVLNTAVCPVDDDLATVVPVVVRYGDAPRATAYRRRETGDEGDGAGTAAEGGTDSRERDGGEPAGDAFESFDVPVEELADWVSESGNPGNEKGLRTVEVHVRRRFLQSGLSLIDTPGVGGLESAQGEVTLGALTMASAVLFVTDASQEFTRPELEFLQAAAARCPHVTCVLTKIDLYPEWRRILEIDRGHLNAAGVDAEIIPVSSFLRLRAATATDKAMNEESGFPTLIERLRTGVVEPRTREAAATAAIETAFVVDQLRAPLAAEQEALAAPEAAAPAVVERLADARRRAASLAGGSAVWQQTLTDGIQDLVAETDHAMRERFRTVVRTAEGIIDRSDPETGWPEFETWLRRQVTSVAVEVNDLLMSRTTELSERVADLFDGELQSASLPQLDDPMAALGRVSVSTEFTSRRIGPANLALTVARGSSGGVIMVGMAAGLLGLAVAAPISIAVGALLGRKALKDERTRQLGERRRQAKATVRSFVDESSFLVTKDTKDDLRRIQRHLRDQFTAHARLLQRSTADALEVAERARAMPDADRQARAPAVEGALHDLAELRRRAEAMADPAGAQGRVA